MQLEATGFSSSVLDPLVSSLVVFSSSSLLYLVTSTSSFSMFVASFLLLILPSRLLLFSSSFLLFFCSSLLLSLSSSRRPFVCSSFHPFTTQRTPLSASGSTPTSWGLQVTTTNYWMWWKSSTVTWSTLRKNIIASKTFSWHWFRKTCWVKARQPEVFLWNGKL